MYKVVITGLAIVFLISGCSVSRRNVTPETGNLNDMDYNLTVNSLQDLNLSTRGFYIRKAELEIIADGEKENAILSVKKSVSGSYQVSIRSRTGIEVARLYLDKDTVLVNQRIDKIFSYGNPESVLGRYGFYFGLIPVIFGDISLQRVEQDAINCTQGEALIHTVYEKLNVSYKIDCKSGKSKLTTLKNDRQTCYIDLKYRRIKDGLNTVVPDIIRINLVEKDLIVMIEVKEIEIPWDGATGIIPGENYERVELK